MSSRLKIHIHKIDIELGKSVPGYVFGHLQKSLPLFPKNCLEMGVQLLLFFSMSSCDKKNPFFKRAFYCICFHYFTPFHFYWAIIYWSYTA